MRPSVYPLVILAGGLATRLQPLTATLPKALIPINGRPFIDHQLRLLARHGIQKIILCLGHLGEMIQSHVGDGRQFGLSVDYCFDGPALLGTGGAIKRALPQLGDRFFVTYGDSYLDVDYASIQAVFEASQKQGLMTVFHNQGQWDTSNIEYSEGRILVYDKQHPTPRMRHIDYGLGLLKSCAFDSQPDRRPFDLAAVYQRLLKENQLAAYEVPHRFYETGSFAGIKELEYYLSHQNAYTFYEKIAQ